MAYTPTKGVFVNGRIIDADDILNEFTAISIATKENSEASKTLSEAAKKEATDYTDNQLISLKVDGGTF